MAPDFSGYERFRADRNGRVLTLTLTAPNPVNAVDGAMHRELARVFLDAQDDPDSDLIVLTGAGRAFWEGDTLVVHTTGLSGQVHTQIITRPQSRVIERF
ncbi:MAG: enoyl-CoA hydratase-related protein [Hyphomonadaceae bacterium]